MKEEIELSGGKKFVLDINRIKVINFKSNKMQATLKKIDMKTKAILDSISRI